MATSLTAQQLLMARYSSNSWPNVTLPDFDKRFTDANSLAGVAFLGFNPLVTGDKLAEWVSYSQANQGWIAQDWSQRDPTYDAGPVNPALYIIDETGEAQVVDIESGKATDLHYPMWQIGPTPLSGGVIGYDLYQIPGFTEKFHAGVKARHTLLTGVVNLTGFLENLATDNKGEEPHSCIFEPVFSDFADDANVTAFVIAGLPWEYVFADILPTGTRWQHFTHVSCAVGVQTHLRASSLPGTDGFIAQVEVSCGGSFTYLLNGREAEYAGQGLLGKAFDMDYIRTYPFADTTRYMDTFQDDCDYTIHVSATTEFQKTFFTHGPIIFSVAVSSCFLIFALVFFVYDWNVRHRQTKLLHAAERTNAIVTNLFPKDVRERIMADAEEQAGKEYTQKQFRMSRGQLKELLDETAPVTSIFKTKPIADLFPEVTVMFADLVGFTAWSSTREPAQVFTLLETIYHEFDQIAKRRRVFKVETVGDCYVAVAGLPEYRKDHAVVMVSSDQLHVHSVTGTRLTLLYVC